MAQLQAQVTPLNANSDAECGADCWDIFSWSPEQDGSGNNIPGVGVGEANDANCNTVIDVGVEYEGNDTSPDVTGTAIGANLQGSSPWTDTWTFSFGLPLTNPVFNMSALFFDSQVSFTDCNGTPISATDISTGNPYSGMGNDEVQLIGTFSCIIVTVMNDRNDSYDITVGTCLGADPFPPCVNCGPNEAFRYLTLTNRSGTGTGATADVNLNGVLYGTAEVLFSDLSISEDLSGSAFGAFANGNTAQETFLLQIDLCDPISVQQVDVLGLETESQVWIGTGLTGSGVNGVPTGLALTQCGGSNNMQPTGNMVTNTAANCANQSNGNYTVGGATVSTLFFRYVNPVGGCRFDKATFRIGACVPDGADAVPTCPLTEVTLTDDPDGFAAAILSGGTGAAFTTIVTRDVNGNYFNQTCSQIQNEAENGTSIPVATFSPCSEVVDENDCEFCTPVPPCVACGPNESYEFLTLANATGSGTGTTADVLLNGLIYGDAEVLFSNLSINEDLTGSAFGAFANGNAMEETFVLQVNLCEPITVQQVDIIGLETESQVWVGTGITGTGMMATPTGLTMTQCAGSMNLTESGNMVTNSATSCANQSNGNYTVGTPTVSTLYFRYTNPAGGCRFDKATFRIGTCVPELPEAIPTCPLVLLEVTEQDGVTTSNVYQDVNGLYFTTAVCTDPIDIVTPVQTIAISPCATTMVTGECEFCCDFEVTCPTATNLGTFNCNTLGNIPAMPTVRTTAGGDITVDNAAGDYQIQVGDMPCGTIVANTSDNITAPDVCAMGGQVITRTVTIFDDENGNGVFDMGSEETPVSCTFTINITEDTTPPVITCPANVTIECTVDTSPATNGMASATDNCSSMANIAITSTDNSSQTATGCGQYEYTIIRTWLATDACGNTASCLQTIEVEDTTNPVITCPANITIECTVDTSPATNGIATATDNCSSNAEITIESSDVSTQTASGCGQYDYSITRTWTATDVCGNSSTCVQIITVEDTTGPVITCPADQSLVCNTDPLPIALTSTEFLAIGGTATDNCADLSELTVSFVDQPINQAMLDFCSADPADRTLTRTYTVTDICGNSTTCEQDFVYDQSVIDPVITVSPPDLIVDCAVNAIPQTHLLEFVTDCAVASTTVVSEPSTNGTAGCPGSTIQYTYTVTDICGRSVSTTQTYTLANEGPEFVCPVDVCIIECPADADMIQEQFDDYASLATVITSCSENDVTITNSFNPTGFIPQNCNNPTISVVNAIAYQIVTFSATDNCGRNSTCTALVVIQDNDGPTINGSIPVGIADCADGNQQAAYMNWINLALSNLTAMDDCTNGAVDVSFSPASPNTDCSSGLATTNVAFTATDACGNVSIINASYQIIDYGSIPMATVSGSLMTEEYEAVELVEVSVEGGSFNNMMTTSEDGGFEFALEMNQNHSITPSRNDNPLNGITSYDLILMGQHLLEIQTLDSPYKLIAADVNRSGSISISDMIELRRMILLLEDQFTNNTSWRFVDADYTFTNPSNPFENTFPEAVSINNLSQAELRDFVAIKIGDLNGSASPTLLGNQGDTRDLNKLVFQVEDQQLTANQTYTVDFTAKDFNQILGYQFTLGFDPNQLTLVDFEAGALEDLTAENFGDRAKEGMLTASWNVFEAISIADGATLFSFTFLANADLNLSEAIQFNGDLINSEAYSKKESLMNLGLYFDTKVGQGELSFKLLQNQPNPFKQETVIGFHLPEATKATLTIFDLAGRIVWTQTKAYDTGMHQVLIAKDKLEGNGVYYYQLSTAKATATRKMVLIK